MSVIALEKRVAELEAAVGMLLADRSHKPAKDWRRVVGKFEGDQLMKEIDAAGRRIRRVTLGN